MDDSTYFVLHKHYSHTSFWGGLLTSMVQVRVACKSKWKIIRVSRKVLTLSTRMPPLLLIVNVDGPGKSSMCVVWDSEQGGLDPGQLALALLLTFFLKFWDLILEKLFLQTSWKIALQPTYTGVKLISQHTCITPISKYCPELHLYYIKMCIWSYVQCDYWSLKVQLS